MLVYFDENDTLRIEPESTIERMALKYWVQEYKDQGDRVFVVDFDNPLRLPSS